VPGRVVIGEPAGNGPGSGAGGGPCIFLSEENGGSVRGGCVGLTRFVVAQAAFAATECSLCTDDHLLMAMRPPDRGYSSGRASRSPFPLSNPLARGDWLPLRAPPLIFPLALAPPEPWSSGPLVPMPRRHRGKSDPRPIWPCLAPRPEEPLSPVYWVRMVRTRALASPPKAPPRDPACSINGIGHGGMRRRVAGIGLAQWRFVLLIAACQLWPICCGFPGRRDAFPRNSPCAARWARDVCGFARQVCSSNARCWLLAEARSVTCLAFWGTCGQASACDNLMFRPSSCDSKHSHWDARGPPHFTFAGCRLVTTKVLSIRRI